MGVMTRSNDPGDMFNQKHYNWNVGVDVTIPIFDGFSTKAKVDAAKAKYQQAILSKEDIADQIAVDIRRGCLDLTKALAIIDSQKDNVAEAKEALRIAIVSYNNGVGTNLDVLDAQTSLGQIEKTLSEAVYDYLMAQAFLDRTMGVSFIEKIEAGSAAPAVNKVAAGDMPAKK
jgi:outer membrane protein TolC